MNPEAPTPEIPDNVTLYTQLPFELPNGEIAKLPPELFVVYEDDHARNVFGSQLSEPESIYRTSYDLMQLRLAIQKLYDTVKMPGIYRLRHQTMAWARTLS